MTVKTEFWATREESLRRYLERGLSLRETAKAIGATYNATKTKAWRLGILDQKSPPEAASASEWVLAGYGAEKDSDPSEGLQSDLSARGNLVGIESPQPIAADSTAAEKPPRKRVKTKGYRGFVSKEAYERNYADEIPAMAEYAREATVEPSAVDVQGEEQLELVNQHPVTGDVWVVDKNTGRVKEVRPNPELGPNQSSAVDVQGAEEPVGGAEDTNIECWFCHACQTMTLLEKAENGEWACSPRRPDCPIGKPQNRKKARKRALKPPPELPPVKPRAWDFPAPGGCVFPFGDVGQPGFGFCAEPVQSGAPYCQKHIRRVYGRKGENG